MIHSTQKPLHHLYGRLAVFLSALCFYLATVALRWAKEAGVHLDSSFFVFSRFLMGFLMISGLLLVKHKVPHPRRLDLILGRVVFNVVAVACFFKAVELTTAAESNILNMTYPLFVTLFSWFLFTEQRDIKAVGVVVIAFCGILLVASPGEFHLQMENLWGLASGILSGIAILFLNRARQYNDTDTVLFYVFTAGTLFMYIGFHQHIHVPTRQEFSYLAFSALMGIIGQYCITLGFRHVSAVEGSIISSTRILLAAFLGPLLTADPMLALTGWLGALLILAANLYFILRKSS